jgi:predicted DNA-binding transcriptional regulator AlpA
MDATNLNTANGKAAFSIDEFCNEHGISRATFYNLKKTGEAPQEMKVGARRLISIEAAAAWRRQMEAKVA